MNVMLPTMTLMADGHLIVIFQKFKTTQQYKENRRKENTNIWHIWRYLKLFLSQFLAASLSLFPHGHM